MPNHVTHRVIVKGDPEQVALFISTCIKPDDNGEPFFDFNTLIQMPEDIANSDSSSVVNDGFIVMGVTPPNRGLFSYNPSVETMLQYPWVIEAGVTDEEGLKALLLKRSPDCVEVAKKALHNHATYGHSNWYDWSIANWGTKWNSYSFHPIVENPTNEHEFMFDTAWSTPEPIWDALAEKFPTLFFDIVGFDEGWNFAVKGTIEDGENYITVYEANANIYEQTYGYAPEKEEDDDE